MWCSIVVHIRPKLIRLANALAVATIAGIYADNLTFVAEERNADLSTSLESSWFEGVANKESSFNVKSEWRNVVACALSSSLAFWFYQVYSNNLSWSTYDIFDFTIPIKEITSKQKVQIEELYKRYITDIEKNVNTRNVSVESKYTMDVFKEYKIVRSKAIIDEIDDYIGPLYGLTQDEIDFIKNYELEFRMAGE